MTDNKRANMALWDSFGTTDPDHTKKVNHNGAALTSVKPMYMIQKATEAFGPWGIGWGVEIESAASIDGAPMVYREAPGAPGKLITDSNGGVITEKHHETRVTLWYMLDKQKGRIEGVGTCKQVYMTNEGKFKSDHEAPKKSYTSAVKNALKNIGICNDIYLGMFDDEEYVELARVESDVKEKAEIGAAADDAYDALAARYISDKNAVAVAGSGAEINKLFKAFFRDAEIQQQSFKSRGFPKLAEKVGDMLKGFTGACEARRKELDANAARKSEAEEPGAEGAKEEPESEAQPAPKKKASRSTKSKAEGAE